MAFKKTITALDLGTDSFKLLIARKNPKEDKIEIIGEFKKPSVGVRKGWIFDKEEATQGLREFIEEGEKFTSQRIRSVFLNINGCHISCFLSHGSVAVSRADGKISQEDVNRVIEVSKEAKIPPNREIIDYYPLEFIVDGEKGIKDPVGMKGIKLEVRNLLILAFAPHLNNLTESVTGAGLEIEGIIPSPLSSAEAVLDKQQKELGVALLDIGAGTTGMAVFEEGSLIHLAVFPVGSANITNDIAQGLRCGINLAEKIKKEYGLKSKREKKKRKIKISDGEETVQFSSKLLSKIIEARLSDIFDWTSKELKKISRQGLLPAGVVITGGGAKLPKIVELAKKSLKLPAKIGTPKGFSNFNEDPQWSVAAGLILEGIKDEDIHFPLGGFREKIKRIFRIFIP